MFRNGSAGVFAGQNLVHMAPPERVPQLITDYWHG